MTIRLLTFLVLLPPLAYGQVYTSVRDGSLLLSNTPRPDFACVRQLKKSNKAMYQKMVQAASLKYGLSNELLDAVIMAESGYNSRAVSCKGARA